VLNVDGATSKSSQKVNLGLVEEVITLALEARVRLLLNLELNITRFDTRHLVTFATEVNLGTALDTLVNVDVQHLALNCGLLSVALLAAVLLTNNLAFSVAVGADSLEALDHGTHLAHHHLHTLTIAACASLDSTLLAATTITLGTQDGLLQGELGDLALVHVLERDLVDVVDGAGLLGTSLTTHATTEHATEATAAAAEELREEILGVHATAHATLLQSFFAILIVQLALF
jgi:hypothetical protein